MHLLVLKDTLFNGFLVFSQNNITKNITKNGAMDFAAVNNTDVYYS